MRYRSLAVGLALVLVASSTLLAVQITYYTQPAGPVYLALGRNGVMYYTDYSSGAFGYRLQDGTQGTLNPTGSSPEGIAAGLDGFIWFVDSGSNQVIRYNPRVLLPFTYFPVITPFSGLAGITQGPDGNIWFTEYSAGKIGRMTPTGTVTEFTLPNTSAQPYLITVGPDDALWFTEFNASKIGRITTTGSITEYPYPTVSARAKGIALGPDGALWFCESGGGKIGRITTGGVVTEYVSSSNPDQIVSGPSGALWFTDVYYKIGRITTTGVITLYDVDAGNGSPAGIVVGPDGAIWFSQPVGSKLGRLQPFVAGDENGDGLVTVADVFYLINYLFTSGPPPIN